MDWDDSVEGEDSGRSFGKGRGFTPQRTTDSSDDGNFRSNYGNSRGGRGGRGRYDNNSDRNSGGRFGDSGRGWNDRDGGRSNDWKRSNDDENGDDRRGRGDRDGGWGRSNNDDYSSDRRGRGDRDGGRSGGGFRRSNDDDYDNDRRGRGRSDGGFRRSNDDDYDNDRRGGDRNGGRPNDGGWGRSNNDDFGNDRRGRNDRSEGGWNRSNNDNYGDDRGERGNRDRGRSDGGWNRSSDNDNNDDRKGRGDREGGRSESSWRSNDDGEDGRGRGGGRRRGSNDGDDFGGNGEPEKKPEPVTYVPEDRSEDQLFEETGIQKGINFDDYEDIEVRVTGVNKPDPIASFHEAELRELIMSNIKKCGYGKPTPIQKYAIPIVKNGRDLMASAQTGSGKTAAYLLPIIHRLLAESGETQGGSCVYPRALILSPTRELAIQIYENAKMFATRSGLKVELVYGGVQTRHHSAKLSRGCDILIATPGRLKDFLNRGYLKFDQLECVVLDEADRMLDMGFSHDVREIMNHDSMPPQDTRQTLMFSATLSGDVQKLASEFLRRDYLFVTVGIVGGACKDVEQHFIPVEGPEKKPKLISLLEEEDDIYGTLLFVEQKRMADFLATYLSERNFKTTSIHGDRQQCQREEALRDFKSRRMAILVATNVAARGLDIRGVTHVVNFDMPKEVEEYIHRIGRTGRVGNKGKATSFYESKRDSSLANNLVKVLKDANQKVPDFIEQDATGTGDFDTGAFGGYDYRRDDGGFKSDGNQPVAVADVEEWA